jgi:hypothetical protein
LRFARALKRSPSVRHHMPRIYLSVMKAKLKLSIDIGTPYVDATEYCRAIGGSNILSTPDLTFPMWWGT